MIQRIIEKLKDISLNRLLIAFFVILFLYSFITIRLFKIQIIEHDNNASNQEMNVSLEEGYRTVSLFTNPVRGMIYDRDGDVLAYNESVYNLDFFNSASLKTNAEKNAAIYELIQLLKKNNLEKEFDFPLIINEYGQLTYTVADNALLRFLKNCYALPSANMLTEAQKNTTPDELFNYLRHGTSYSSMFGIDDKYTREEALEIMSYRYQLYINNPSYSSIRLVSDIPEDMKVVIMENLAVIPCIEISKSYKRVYKDAVYFSHIIGYIGKINENELNSYKEEGFENYNLNSYVGKSGVEKSYDSYLQGDLGEIKVTINKLGQVVKKEVVSEPVEGNDLHLCVDREAQIAGYYIVEKNVAAILLNKVVNSYSYGTKGTSADGITIPVYEVYNAFIANNLIDIKALEDVDNNTDAEKRVYKAFADYKHKIDNRLREMLDINYKIPYKNLTDYNKSYCDYIYDKLRGDWGIININIDYDSDYFVSYNDGEISLAQWILKCIENGNVNTKAFKLEDGYYESGEIYEFIVKYIFDKIYDETGFDKLLYRTLIFDNSISGRDLCLILYDQGVLKPDKDSYNGLLNYKLSAYDFIKRKINNLELTPAMLALKPYTGSLVVTDPLNGNVIAMCSYPGYDNNKLTNSIDYEYYNKLSNDLSYPMLCSATQSKTTTGSTFKPLTSILALTEGYITTGTYIHDDVKFSKISPSPACWASYGHGSINVSGAIMHSCNYFFFETAYKFSTTSNGNYSDELGLSVIHKYTKKFGFNALSGVEISETMPVPSNTDAIRTSIGYYHNFAPVQIARYATTIANKGTCYNLTLINNVKSKDGNIIYQHTPSVYNELSEVAATSWNAVHIGMNQVVNASPSMKKLFGPCGQMVAGKTGTAQVSKSQPSNALFISFAPYDNPKICVTAVLPNGYTSSNAAATAAEFYSYYFKNINAENLLSGKVYAGKQESFVVGD